MADTPRMVIVPVLGKTGSGHPIVSLGLGQIVNATELPNHGRVSRADLERAYEAACDATELVMAKIRESKDGYESLPEGSLSGAFLNAFAAALGLEIAEDGENG